MNEDGAILFLCVLFGYMGFVCVYFKCAFLGQNQHHLIKKQRCIPVLVYFI